MEHRTSQQRSTALANLQRSRPYRRQGFVRDGANFFARRQSACSRNVIGARVHGL
jgi:hypothetical protein